MNYLYRMTQYNDLGYKIPKKRKDTGLPRSWIPMAPRADKGTERYPKIQSPARCIRNRKSLEIGPKGGKYYIASSGGKVYCDRIPKMTFTQQQVQQIIPQQVQQIPEIIPQQVNLKYFKILGMNPTYNLSDVRKKFIKLAKVHHPNKGGDPDVFKHMLDAYKKIINTKAENQQQVKINIPIKL